MSTRTLLRRVFFVIVLSLAIGWPVVAQNITVTADDYARAEGFLSSYTYPLVYGETVNPNWVNDERFWYRSEGAEGAVFFMVDANRGRKTEAFDHDKLAQALSTLRDTTYRSDALPFYSVNFSADLGSVDFVIKAEHITCELRRYQCTSAPNVSKRIDRNSMASPDGQLAAFIKDHNLWVRDIETGDEHPLTEDGIEDFGYATNNAGWTKREGPVMLWSDDAKKIATFQHDGRGVGEMHLVSTKVGHPELQSWKYPLPEDSVIFRISRVIIDVEANKMVRLQMPPDAHRSTTTDHIAGRGGVFLDVQWREDGSQLAFVSSSRDHKVATLRIADAETGEVRDVLEERVETYYESGVRAENWHVLFDTDEAIWFSERDNWGHLYLYDLATGNQKHQITSGDWAVQQVRHIDSENRVIYFTAGGREPGDPYFQHFYRINFDGSGLKLLTPEPANHEVSLSPSNAYFVDKYSTPDTPPVTLLRDVNGKTLLTLEEADVTQLVASGWQPPVPVKVKARDGETDIYGLMYKPTNFDPAKSYPVLNYLYPGPQSGSVGSRSFRAARSDKQAVAELGFIVVEVDAMGTPGRSKSFHDAYYGNMGDNGIPDQIAAIKELGSRHPWMNLDKVGIWGHSGGGFASTRAILQYPNFYKVAVSGAGNHDNRNYEDDWGEKWQGLLENNPDGTTNYDNQANQLLAKNLEGKLLIAHGTLDSNVPPSNTMLMVDELIKANKDFDLVMIPNAGHGFGAAGTYWMRRRWDYFVKHLLDVEPPKEYEFGKRPPRMDVANPTG